MVVLFSGYGALLLFLRTPTEAVGVDGTSSRVLERRLFSDRPLFRSAAGSPFADRPPLCTGFYRVFLLLVSPLGSSFCRSAPVRVFEELTGFYRVFFGGGGGLWVSRFALITKLSSCLQNKPSYARFYRVLTCSTEPVDDFEGFDRICLEPVVF